MEEQVDYERRNKYLIDRLISTKIDPVYFPLIASIISRRSETFNLSDEYFIRDVESFVNNVKTIEVGKLPKGTGNRFYIKEQKIVISSEWFELKNMSQKIFFEAFAHECTHGMNFEKKENDTKDDRTFPVENNIGTMEVFTECEAHALVYDTPISLLEDGIHKGLKVNHTPGYPSTTHYVDIIAATFGVRRNELLGETIKGPEQLQNFLNQHIDLRCPNSDKNKIFEGFSRNIDLFFRAAYYSNLDVARENTAIANSKIYSFAEEGLDNRLSNLVVEDIDVFKEQFTEIKINQKIVKRLIELGASDKLCEQFREGTSGKYELLNSKLQSIEQILQNDNIKHKQELIQNIQGMRDIEEITKFIDENCIPLDPNMDIEDTISLEEIKKYNKENASIQWDNTKIIEYIESHKEEIKQTREKQPSKFQIFMAKSMVKIKGLFDKVGQFANKLFNKEETKLLPESTEPVKNELKSWDLANYGLDKDEFNEENVRLVEEYISKEDEQPTHNQNEETHEII